MQFDYQNVKSVDDETFIKAAASHNFEDESKYTKSDAEDISSIERMLDAREGILAAEEFYLEREVCECGRNLTFYDFVFTALLDAQHSKSFVLHTLIGTKKIVNQARTMRCSACSRLTGRQIMYGMPASYLCRDQFH